MIGAVGGFQATAGSSGMISVEEAQARVLDEVIVTPPERVDLSEAVGRILREDVIAAADSPEGDNSAMDGYAVRADDLTGASSATPVRLRVVGDIPAGRVPSGAVEPGTAMRIMTGALVPDGADAVVQVELTDAGDEVVSVVAPVATGANVRRRGEDMRGGDVLIEAGVRIGPAEISVLASQQRTTAIRVGRRPVVAILSTGDELVDPSEEKSPGKIVNTNGHLLAALVREVGAIPRMLGIVRDTREETIRALRNAIEADIVVSSGGVSVGVYDFVKEALDALGAETKFWRIAMKPGKPVVFSRLRERLLFGLPGNPASCFVSFHLFVAPALRKMMGQTRALDPPKVEVELMRSLRRAQDRRVYYRVHVTASNGELQAWPLTSQGSGSLTSMIGANGLAVVEPGEGSIAEGERIATLLIGAVLPGER